MLWILFWKKDGRIGIIPDISPYHDRHYDDTAELFEGTLGDAIKRAETLERGKDGEGKAGKEIDEITEEGVEAL